VSREALCHFALRTNGPGRGVAPVEELPAHPNSKPCSSQGREFRYRLGNYELPSSAKPIRGSEPCKPAMGNDAGWNGTPLMVGHAIYFVRMSSFT
jgi:hypothetical protein